MEYLHTNIHAVCLKGIANSSRVALLREAVHVHLEVPSVRKADRRVAARGWNGKRKNI